MNWPTTITGMTALVLRMALGALFIYTGILKVQDPGAFLTDIRSFHLLHDPWAAWVAMGLPWLEILAGLALVAAFWVEGGLACITGMLAVFLAAILWSWHRGLDISCGCFGKQSSGTDYPDLVLRDTLLLVLALALLVHRWAQCRNSARSPREKQLVSSGAAR
jgi:putative oxidoreductase